MIDEAFYCVLMGDFNVQPDNPTVKIDYIFVSKDLMVRSADILEMIASDHRPHVAIIEV